MADVKWCKDFLQKVTRLPVDFPESYLDPALAQKRRPVTIRPSTAKTVESSPKKQQLQQNNGQTILTLKKLGGAGAGHELKMKEGATVSALRAEAAKLFTNADAFTLMYKGRPLTDDAVKIASVITDPTTAVYVNIKKTSTAATAVVLPDAFWIELKSSLGKHAPSLAAAEQLYARFQQEYSKGV